VRVVYDVLVACDSDTLSKYSNTGIISSAFVRARRACRSALLRSSMLRRHEGDSNKAKITTLKSRLWSWVEVEDSKLNSKDALSGWRVITELATTR
jgi:hypothetical protein